jgi:hypothetical protein
MGLGVAILSSAIPCSSPINVAPHCVATDGRACFARAGRGKAFESFGSDAGEVHFRPAAIGRFAYRLVFPLGSRISDEISRLASSVPSL